MAKKKWTVAAELKKRSKGKKTSPVAKKRLAELLGTEVGGQRPGTWPQVSMSLAVHRSQVAEANAKLKAAGTTAYHLPDGRLVCPDAAEKKKVIRMVPHRVDLEAFS